MSTARMVGRRRPERFSVPVATGNAALYPSRWWVPGRCTRQEPPPDFVEKIKEIDPDLAVGWNDEEKIYEIWVKDPGVKTPYCRGWRRLFKVCDHEGNFRRLDERTLAELYVRDASNYKSAEDYFNRMVSVMAEEKAKKDKDRTDRTIAESKEYWKHTLIKMSMRGHSPGNKFAAHHSGD